MSPARARNVLDPESIKDTNYEATLPRTRLIAGLLNDEYNKFCGLN